MKKSNSVFILRGFGNTSGKISICLAIIALLTLLGSVQADIVTQPTPDIASFSIDFTYNASSHILAASGMAVCISVGDPESPDNPIVFDEDSLLNGTFLLSAIVDNAGVASSGSLIMGGKVLGYGETGPLLTANNISYFNSFFTTTLNPNRDFAMFEFVFDITGGEMADMFGGLGAQVYIDLTWVQPAAGVAQSQFTGNFDNLVGVNYFGEGTGNAMADTVPVIPEPITVLLLGLGAVLARKK